jgi:acyl-CoA synthetase (AMP-forming)/AMP-acid ligase II
MGDRTQFVPSHVGNNVLPNLPFFHKLLRYAQRKPSRIAVRDVIAGVEKTFHDLLSDVLALRGEIEKNLSRETLHELAEDKEVYIGLLAPGGYEYTVGFVAIIALGAAVVPMGERHTIRIARKTNKAQLLDFPSRKLLISCSKRDVSRWSPARPAKPLHNPVCASWEKRRTFTPSAFPLSHLSFVPRSTQQTTFLSHQTELSI